MSYRENVLKTANPAIDTLEKKLSMGGLGLAGEAGEVVDLIKKILHHGKPLDRGKLISELGDVRWYLEYLSIALDVSMEEIEAKNSEKLVEKRYKNGFTVEAANAKREDT